MTIWPGHLNEPWLLHTSSLKKLCEWLANLKMGLKSGNQCGIVLSG